MIETILKYRRLVIAVVVLITAALAPFAAGLRPDNSVESMGVINDPAIAEMHHIEKTFGSDEFISVSFSHPDIFGAEGLKLIADLSRDLGGVANIVRVTSLTEAEDIRPTIKDGEDVLEIAPLIRHEWIEHGTPTAERERILKNPMYQRLLFNRDGTASSLYAQLKPLGKDNRTRDDILSAVRNITERYQSATDVEFHLLGMPVVDRKVYGVVEKEQNLTTGVIIGLVALVFWLLYKRWSLVLLPVLFFGIVSIWTTGIIGLTGLSFNWLLAMAPAVVLIISICNSIHVINAYLLHPEPDARARLIAVVRLLWLPCFFTCLTDISGFFSISTSQIAPIRDFGLCVGMGSVISFLLMIFVFPTFLSWIRIDVKQTQSTTLSRWIGSFLDKALHLGITRTNTVLVSCVVAAALGLLGLTRLTAEEHYLTMYKWGNEEFLRANEFVKKEVGGGSEFSAFVNAGSPDAALKPAALKALESIQRRISAELSDVVIKTLSLADLIKYANQAVHGGDPAYGVIPDTQDEVAELLLIYAMSEKKELLSSLITPDHSQTRVRVFTAFTDSAQQNGNGIQRFANILKDASALSHMTFVPSGRVMVMLNTFYSLIYSQYMTLLIAFVIILAGMCLLFRSFKIGLICMIPNILPILFCLGMEGWLGIEVDVATSMVASTIIGVTVDDTIHFMWNLRRKIQEGIAYETALHQVFHETASAAFFSTVVVSAGFMGLAVSQLWPTTHFGMVTALSCIVALVTELFLTPALLYKLRPFEPGKVPAAEALRQLVTSF